MGRYCDICGRERPHEHFGGRGQRARICRKCRGRPRAERNRLLWTTEILNFLDQSNISAKNLKRLQVLEAETLDDVARLASAVRQIAIVCPGKRKRWKRLKQQHGELFKLALEVGLLEHREHLFATDYPAALLGDEDVFGIWIEPRQDESEPTLEDIRFATDDAEPY